MAIINKKGVPQKAVPKSAKQVYQLPEDKSTPSNSLQNYSILIYGKKKIGKSSLAAQFPKTLFLMCEPGGKALELFQVPVKNWRDFEGYVDLFIADPRFDTAVVDTADYSYEYCMEYVCQKLVIDHPSDEEYGKGWNAVKKEYTRVVNKLLHSGKGVIFISHSKDEEIKTRRNDSYHKVTSSMSKQAKDVLEGLIDIWVSYDYDGKRRFLMVQGNDEVDAGHRLKGHFQYADGQKIERIDMGKSEEEGYRNLVAAFNNHPEKPTTEEVSKKKLVLKKK